MKKLILGLILGLILSSSISYAYRISKPQRITDFDQRGLVIVNENFERLWDMSNGRMIYDVVSTAPTKKSDEGATKIYSSGGIYKIYIYLNSGWRVWTSD